jgi:hypothetical protein
MTGDQQRTVIDFCLHRVGKEALTAALGFDIDADPAAVFRLLADATASGDADSVECALVIAQGRSGDGDVVPLLVELLRARWHTRHEDVAFWLQQLRDARAIDALAEAALTKHAYLAYDNSYALARKCTWALADIGTAEAQDKLRALAAGADEEIAGYARRRLDRWSDERARKAAPVTGSSGGRSS